MALPKHIRPEYSTTIPSSGKKIKYQPFTVKEEKVLILAAETQDPDEITNAVSNVLSNCVSSPQDFKVEELALFDIEFLFLKTRAKSAGEKIRVTVTDPEDETYTVDHEIDIDKIKVQKNPKHTDTIQINDKVMVKMRYPDISFFNEGIDVTSVDSSIEVMCKCISQIVVDEEVYNKADMSDEEVMEWVEGLTSEDFKKIISFFETMPRLSHSITLKNKHTNKNFTVKLEGLQDFF
jgi:disulfide oxidoreductase YuzD